MIIAMKHLYIKPEIETIVCQSTNLLDGSKPNTEWEMNPDGHNGTGIGDGTGKDPDADAKRYDVDFASNWEFASNWDFENNWEFKSN